MKNGRGMRLALVLIGIALAAVLAVILWKEYEYGVSGAYYENLRGLVRPGGWTV